MLHRSSGAVQRASGASKGLHIRTYLSQVGIGGWPTVVKAVELLQGPSFHIGGCACVFARVDFQVIH